MEPIRAIEPAGPDAFDQVFALMDAAFPDSEMRTYTGQQALFGIPFYRLYVHREAQERIAAFLAAWEFENFRFVEHIAVDESLRGGGIGAAMLCDFAAQDSRPIVLEVEPPETDIAQRRIGFYKRLGFALNLYSYEQPPLRNGQSALPLLVMSYPHALSKAEFEQYKDVLYREVYGCIESEPPAKPEV